MGLIKNIRIWLRSLLYGDSRYLLEQVYQNNLPCLLTWPNIPYSFSVTFNSVEDDVFVFKMLVPDVYVATTFYQHATFTFNYIGTTYQFTCSVFKDPASEDKSIFYGVTPARIYKVKNRVAKRLQILPKYRIPITFKSNDNMGIVGDIWNISTTGVGVVFDAKYQHNFVAGKIFENVSIGGKSKKSSLHAKIKIIWTNIHRNKLYLGCSFIENESNLLALENILKQYQT